MHHMTKGGASKQKEDLRSSASTTCSTAAPSPRPSSRSPKQSVSDTGSEDARSDEFASVRTDGKRYGSTGAEVAWEELYLGHKIKPYFGHAHCADDARLISRLLEIVQAPSIGGTSVRMLLRSLKFLRLCDYSIEDICSTLAHASAYFAEAFPKDRIRNVDKNEVGHIFMTYMFIAHCYVQDETCPLHVWHENLFADYCNTKTLNAAVIKLMEMRGYVLRLDGADLHERFESLLTIVRVKPQYCETGPFL
jgi:hypothetical protein